MIITNDIVLLLFQFQVSVTLREIPSIMIMFTYTSKTVSSVCVKADFMASKAEMVLNICIVLS